MNHSHKPKEPISTWTNLSFIITGFLSGDVITCIGLTFVGITSFWYHWSGSNTARYWDVRAIYAILIILISRVLIVGYGGEAPIVFLYAVFGIAIFWLKTEELSQKRRSMYYIGGLFGILTALLIFLGTPIWFVFTFLIAFLSNIPFLFNIDIKPVWVDFLHGIWHILAAIGFHMIDKLI